MLTIFVDVQCLQGQDLERGIPRWAVGFLTEMKGKDCQLVALQNSRLPAIDENLNSLFVKVTYNSRQELRDSIDSNECVYLVLSPFEPVRPLSSLLPLHVVDAQLPIAVVMYDLTPYLFPSFYQSHEQDARINQLKKMLFQGASLFLCISENTKKDLQRLWGTSSSQVITVGVGVSDFFYPVGQNRRVLEKYKIDKSFIFCIGRRDPRKQTQELISAFADLKRQWPKPLQLVITCNVTDETRHLWETHAASQGLERSEVVITGSISDHELRDLYSMCDLFVEPSLYEGFGYPPAEAAACGAVVITSNTSSLPEVLKNQEATFDPSNRKLFSQSMHQALEDETFRSLNRARSKNALQQHTWKLVCDRALEAFISIGRKVEIPHRGLGQLAPLGTQFRQDVNTRISLQAVGKFYSTIQFDSAEESTKK